MGKEVPGLVRGTERKRVPRPQPPMRDSRKEAREVRSASERRAIAEETTVAVATQPVFMCCDYTTPGKRGVTFYCQSCGQDLTWAQLKAAKCTHPDWAPCRACVCGNKDCSGICVECNAVACSVMVARVHHSCDRLAVYGPVGAALCATHKAQRDGQDT